MSPKAPAEVAPTTTPAAPTRFRNRIVGHGEEAPDQLLANPRNWRVHPAHQQAALAGVLESVGWVQQIVVNKRTGFVVDGHLRVTLAMRDNEHAPIPVTYVDLSDEEERLILATFDPVSAMAGTDTNLLAALLLDLPTQDAHVTALLEGLALSRGIAGLEFDQIAGKHTEEGVSEPVVKIRIGDYTKHKEALAALAEFLSEHADWRAVVEA